jgi:hypothetical protein
MLGSDNVELNGAKITLRDDAFFRSSF